MAAKPEPIREKVAMVTARISTVPDGWYHRVTVELALAEQTGAEHLQQQLMAVCPGFEPAPLQSLHVTVLHLGRPHELLSQIRRDLPRDAWPRLPQFMEVMERVMSGWLTANCQTPEFLQVLWLQRFGPASAPVAGLLLRRHPALTRLRGSWWSDVLMALAELGVAHPAEFAARSDHLRWGNPRCTDHIWH